MKQFFAQIKAVPLPSPAAVWARVEQGAEAIHELPYRFARWLPTAPQQMAKLATAAQRWLYNTDLAQEIRDIGTWLENRAEAIHQIPYRLAAWLPTVPQRWHDLWQGVFAWMRAKDITPRLQLMIPLFLVGMVLPYCFAPLEQSETIYLLTKGGEPEVIFGDPEAYRELSGLTLYTDRSGRDAQMVLDEGQTIKVQHGTRLYYVTTRRETVENLLRRLEVERGEDEMVVLDISGETPVIRVQSEYTFDWQETTPIDYTTSRVPNYLKAEGKETVLQEGQQGTILSTYRDVYQQGEHTDTLLVCQEITDPVEEIIEYGTRVKEVSRSDRIKKVVYNADGSGYLLFKSGKTMTFSEKVTCSATAYSIGSWTASGLPTKVGHIAVDPKVFPYHTRFYIFTNDGYLVYGNAVAADCGKSIKGYKIDLWFETFDEACWFGRRDCTVFVLD